MNNVYGVCGKLLRVNLTNKTSTNEKIPYELWIKYIGGRGLGVYYLTKEVPPETDPYSKENKLIFMIGPLGGTIIPGSNKICVSFKSPLTNSYSYSLCGGSLGPKLKYAGYDGIIIEGKSEKAVYLNIENDKVECKDASHIWGKLIPESEKVIREELGGNDSVQIAVIGPAGENLCNFACITSGFYREFGRGGNGAIMGSKNLKGIAINGSKDLNMAEKAEAVKLSKRLIANLRNSNLGKVRRMYGTMELVEKINNAGFWTTRNFSEGYFEDGYNLEGKSMREQVIIGDSSCHSCPIACGKRTILNRKDGSNQIMEGPEFETVGMLGSNCGISDWNTLLKASKICDSYGFDTINAGACVSMMMEAFEKGALTKEEVDGLEMRFGNESALLIALEKIGMQDGFGKLLAKGLMIAGQKLGISEFAIHSKGQSFPVYDPRGAKAMALTYATSPKGAHHMFATTFGAELAMGNRFEEEGKAILERNQNISMCLVDSLGLCSSMRAGITLNDQAKAYSLITGIEMDVKGLQEAAERVINLERIYNVKMGFNRKNDTLPERFLKTPLPKGKSKGHIVDLQYLLDDYYNIMGWDSNGIPKEEKLKELGLYGFL
jgi:aldehyde:ferredoxin oxidoreductase